MSLVIRIAVNDELPLAVVTAQRIHGGTDPDDVNVYRVVRFEGFEPTLLGLVKAAENPHVEHRYGDGAVVLARKALEAVT